MIEFKVGAVVKLTSNGQKMTVRSFEKGKVRCNWFDKEGSLHELKYNLDDLVHV